MKYALLLYQDAAFEREWEAMDDAARAEAYAGFARFDEAAGRHGVTILGGNELGLSPTGTIVHRTESDFIVTEGPFAEVTEHLGGYFELDAPDLDAVLAACRELPIGTMEIRPIVEQEAPA